MLALPPLSPGSYDAGRLFKHGHVSSVGPSIGSTTYARLPAAEGRQEPRGDSVPHVIIVFTILGLGSLAVEPAMTQQLPAAIVTDPPADKEFPAALAVVVRVPHRLSTPQRVSPS